MPDISAISGENTAYKTVWLYSDTNDTRGSNNSFGGNNVIGQARCRAIEYDSGTVGQTNAQYKLYLWDIKMFTYLTLSDIPSPLLTASHGQGVRLEGVSSGAVGYVVSDQVTTTETRVVLIKESGTFSSGELLIASDSAETSGYIENSSNTDLTVASFGGSVETTFTFDQTRSFYMSDTGGTAAQNFTADAVLLPPLRRAREKNSLLADGTDAGGANANSRSGAGEAGDTNANSGATFLEDRLLARLTEAEKNNALEKLPKKVIKTLLTTNNSGSTDTQFTLGSRVFVIGEDATRIPVIDTSVADDDEVRITGLTNGDGGIGTTLKFVNKTGTTNGWSVYAEIEGQAAKSAASATTDFNDS